MKMNKVAMFLCLTLVCGTASARSLRPGPEVYAKQDQVVSDAITAVKNKGYAQESGVTTAVIGGQCGFVGCSSTHLVVFTFRTGGSNTGTASVVAKVTYTPLEEAKVQLVPSDLDRCIE
ncbi:MAG: hypothetical protein HY078_07025 [Elusimicrobia bacterium]|nr:hypothetical protein [Elusimicrobiota bacterium]